jgi:hypothetical protein
MKDKVIHHSTSSNAVYGLGFIGAAIYYTTQATGFTMGVIGFLKALVWPAILEYEALKQLPTSIINRCLRKSSLNNHPLKQIQ